MRNPVFALLVVFTLSVAELPSQADIVSVDLTLDPPSSQVNRLELAVEISGLGLTQEDADTSDLAGNMLADLTIDFHPVIFEADTTGLELTGGRFTATEVSFEIDFLSFGTIEASGTDIAGTFDTPSPPGSVTGSTFPGSDHVAILNEGTVAVSGTGTIGSLLGTFVLELGDDPITTSTTELGTLVVSSPTIVADQATYDVTLTQPVSLDEELYNEGGIVVTLAGGGVVQASGQFTFTIPEPATLGLLVVGGLTLLRRKRLT